MESNRYSSRRPDGLAALAAAVDELAAQDLDGLADPVLAERVLTLRRLADRLEGQWLKELAAVDARGAAGAEQDQQVGSTWPTWSCCAEPNTAVHEGRWQLIRGPDGRVTASPPHRRPGPRPNPGREARQPTMAIVLR